MMVFIAPEAEAPISYNDHLFVTARWIPLLKSGAFSFAAVAAGVAGGPPKSRPVMHDAYAIVAGRIQAGGATPGEKQCTILA